DPHRFQRNLASSLRTLALRQHDAGQSGQSTITASEHVTICREIVASGRPYGDGMLADALTGLTNALQRAKRSHEALSAANERLAIERRRVADYATALGGRNRPGDAARAAGDAVTVLRQLAAE